MIEIEDGGTSDLAKLNSGSLSRMGIPVSVGALERSLLASFPRSDAEEWDRMGLSAGDPAALVSGVFVTLDPTVNAIEAAAANGANVLVTHHPVYLAPPEAFSPSEVVSSTSGIAVWKAIESGVALMSFHTALDVAAESMGLLPQLLSLDFQDVLIPLSDDPSRGYGQLCAIRDEDRPMRLEQLAARCVSVFGCSPRVWGSASLEMRRVVTMNGSAGIVVDKCRKMGVDCLICGELRYHDAQDLAQAGVAVIELGHDVSEFPLTAVLAQAVASAGIPKENVTIYDQLPNWWVPDSQRM